MAPPRESRTGSEGRRDSIAAFLGSWKVLFGSAGVIVALLAGIVLPLPSSEQQQMANIARWLVALLIGLLATAMTRHSKPRDARLWVRSGLCTLAVGLVTLAVYSNLRQGWVWPDGHDSVRAAKTMVVGSHRTHEGDLVYALAKKQFGPHPTPTDMLDGAFPARYRLWDARQIALRTAALTVLYIATMLLLSAATVSIVHGAVISGAFKKR